MDYGEEGFEKTLEYLKKNNIGYFGAGNIGNNFNNPCILNVSGSRIALLGYSCASTHAVFGNENRNGSALLDKEQIFKDIQSVKNKADFIIVQLHWGDEEIKYPKFTDVQTAHQIIDCGADMIIGHHAHVIQSIEVYKDKHIFYGIGNCLFPDFDMPSHHNGVRFTKRSRKIQREKNKQSIVVELHDDLKVTYATAMFDGCVVKNHKVSIPQWLPMSCLQYAIYLNLYRRVGIVRQFLRKPKVPTAKQIRTFLGLQ